MGLALPPLWPRSLLPSFNKPKDSTAHPPPSMTCLLLKESSVATIGRAPTVCKDLLLFVTLKPSNDSVKQGVLFPFDTQGT